MPLPADAVIPAGKPYAEWVDGVAHRKLSPNRDHARLQMKLGALLLAWGESRGEICSELDLDVTSPAGETRRYLPDVAFISFERLAAAGQRAAPVPEVAPDLAVEILSPRDDRAYLADKVAAYLAAGSRAVIVVDPAARTFAVHRAAGVVTLGAGEAFEDAAFPGLRIAVDATFAVLDRGPGADRGLDAPA